MAKVLQLLQTNEGELFQFSAVSGKKISASFSSSDLSSCGGLMLVREAEKECDIIDRISSCIKDDRRQYLIDHRYVEMIRQRVYQIACGDEDCNDCERLRDDSIMKMCVGRLPSDAPLASQSSMSRLENKVTRNELYAIAEQFLEAFISSYDRTPRVSSLTVMTPMPTHTVSRKETYSVPITTDIA